MKILCRKCGQNLEVGDDLAGQQVRCPTCDFIVDLPSADLSSERDSLEVEDDVPAEIATPAEHGNIHATEPEELPENVGDVKLTSKEPSEWFLRIPEGIEFGPVGHHELDAWVSQGRVATDCRIRNEFEGWKPALEFYPELATDGNPFSEPVQTSPLKTNVREELEPHRGVLILSLALVGCLVPFLSVCPAVMGTRDLRQMAAAKMDPQGAAMTRSGQAIAMVASMIWCGAFGIGLLATLISAMSQF